MSKLLSLVRWEFFRQVRKSGFLVLYGIAALLAILVFAFGVILSEEVIPISFELSYFQLASGMLWAVSPVLAIVTVALVHAADLQGGYCRTLTARGVARDIILISKALLTLLLLLGFHLAALALALVLTVALSPNWDGSGTGLTSTGGSFLNSLLYAAFAIALTHWRQSVAFTVGVGIAVFFLEAIAYPLAGALGDVLGWPVSTVTSWTLWGMSQGLQGDSAPLDRAWYFPIAAGYVAALVGLSLLAFRKFDLRAGSD